MVGGPTPEMGGDWARCEGGGGFGEGGGAVAGDPSLGAGTAPKALEAARAARETPFARESEGRRLGKVDEGWGRGRGETGGESACGTAVAEA